MRVRWIGLTLALVAVGLAAGWAVGQTTRDEPDTFATPTAVPAVDPSWPAEPAPVLPDSDYPPLATALHTHRETVGNPPFELTLPIPDGWVRNNPAPGEWRWYPNNEFELNTYFLRVRLVGNRHQAIPDAREERLNALQDAADVADLHVETTTSDGFRATYVADQHLRVAMERFIGIDGGTTAFAWIALIGREADREGMDELFPRIADGAKP